MLASRGGRGSNDEEGQAEEDESEWKSGGGGGGSNGGHDARLQERLRHWRAFRLRLVESERARTASITEENVRGDANDTNATDDDDAATDDDDDDGTRYRLHHERKYSRLNEFFTGVFGRNHDDRQYDATAAGAGAAAAAAHDLDLSALRDAQLHRRWAHPIPRIESGAVVLASPQHFDGQQQYFADTVVFILEHHAATGTTGVILNRIALHHLRTVRALRATDVARHFATRALFLGGPVGLDTLLVLHAERGVEGAHEILEGGIYCGGVETLVQRARDGALVHPERVRFFCGYCGWSAGQLEEEVRNGVWRAAAVSAEMVLGEQRGAPFAPQHSDGCDDGRSISDRHRRDRGEPGDRVLWHPKRLWNEIRHALDQHA